MQSIRLGAPMTDNPWTDTRIAELRRLMAEKLSFSRIAARLKVSRNAAIGKAKRLSIGIPLSAPAAQPALTGLKRPIAVSATPYPLHEPAELRVPPRRLLRPLPIPPAVAVNPLNLPIDALTPFHCRYITNYDLSNATYCGHPTAEATSWCAFHLDRVRAPEVAIAPPLAPTFRRARQPQT
jgi:hypothetical protein